MDESGEAAERAVRITLDGMVYALKVSGNGALHLATFLRQSLADENKTSGQMKMASMLKSGKELKVFTLTEDELKAFAAEAKRYGVTYCVLRDKDTGKGHPVEVMVKAEDASKIQRIFERLEFASVDTSEIESEVMDSIEKARQEQSESQEAPERAGSETKDAPEKGADEPIRKEAAEQQNPFAERTSHSPPSRDTSERQETDGKDSRTTSDGRKSVKKEIRQMEKERKSEAGKQSRQHKRRGQREDDDRQGRPLTFNEEEERKARRRDKEAR